MFKKHDIKVKELDCDYTGLFCMQDNILFKDVYPNIKDRAEIYAPLMLNRTKEDKGCYIIYVTRYDKSLGERLLSPLYVGRSVTFLSRFRQHYRGGFIDKYWKDCDNLWDDYEPLNYGLWVISNATERCVKEHILIDKYKPYYNKRVNGNTVNY